MHCSPVFPLCSSVSAVVSICSVGHEDDLDAVVVLLLEGLVSLGGVVEFHPMGDDARRINVALLDALQERMQIAMDVGLSHLKGQPLGMSRAKRHFVEQSAIDSRNRDHPALSACHDRLPEGMRAIRAQ